jgi:hypothetical protein
MVCDRSLVSPQRGSMGCIPLAHIQFALDALEEIDRLLPYDDSIEYGQRKAQGFLYKTVGIER